MAVNWPTSPFVGQIYTYLGLAWVCSNAGPPAVWDLVPNQGQASNLVRVISRVVTTEGVAPTVASINYV